MKRLLLSVSGGIIITLFLFVLKNLMVSWPGLDRWSIVLGIVLFWPFILWKEAFVPDCDLCFPIKIFAATLIYDVLIFSLLTYVLLRLFWKGTPRPQLTRQHE